MFALLSAPVSQRNCGGTRHVDRIEIVCTGLYPFPTNISVKLEGVSKHGDSNTLYTCLKPDVNYFYADYYTYMFNFGQRAVSHL